MTRKYILNNQMASCLLRSAVSAICVTELMAATNPDFESWAALHGKQYATPEERLVRQYYFTKNVYAIENHKSATVLLGINKFADVSQEEFSARYLGYRPSMRATGPTETEDDSQMSDISLPESVDWVAAGAVTGVKNQGQCGSCWSFSTTGSVEGAWFLKTGDLISLSEQQLVDCSGPEGNQGCNGGMMDQAFEYIIKNGGICSETAYPYTASQGSCASINCTSVAHISSYVDVQPKNDTALMIAVAQQPVSVAVEADGLDWQFYMGGVVTDACGSNLDHGVLVVGYGTDATAGDFWKVKNSWGPEWGEQGYIRIGRGAKFDPSGECGILLDPSYPVV
jgi:C1A family cysteine protease